MSAESSIFVISKYQERGCDYERKIIPIHVGTKRNGWTGADAILGCADSASAGTFYETGDIQYSGAGVNDLYVFQSFLQEHSEAIWGKPEVCEFQIQLYRAVEQEEKAHAADEDLSLFQMSDLQAGSKSS